MSSYSRYRGIIFTDFDGTLFCPEGNIPEANYKALTEAEDRGYLRVIATGRSLYSFRKIMITAALPLAGYIDYVIFSSGTGVLDLKTNRIISTSQLKQSDAAEAGCLLLRNGIDFMIHSLLPDNHHMIFVKANGAVNPDFYRRIKIYSEFAQQLETGDEDSEFESIEKACAGGAAQLVAIIPPFAGPDREKYSSDLIEFLRRSLPECSVIRTTSPIDGNSLWIEIFNKGVSKSHAAAELTKKFGLTSEDCLAVGNDFNDEDLLRWAGSARTVDEAPAVLKTAAPAAGPSAEGAVAKAFYDFMKNRRKEPV